MFGWFYNRKLKRQLRQIRDLEIREVNSVIHKVYNPIGVISKPKYQHKISFQEREMVDNYTHMVYDVPLDKYSSDSMDSKEKIEA